MTQEQPGIATDRPVSAEQAPEVRPDTPTVQDDWRAALAAALQETAMRTGKYDGQTLAQGLLPTLRQIVAAELRAVAADLRQRGVGPEVFAVDDRIDALDAIPDHGKA